MAVASPTAPTVTSAPPTERDAPAPGREPRRARHGRSASGRRGGTGLALPIGVVGIAVGCLLPWRAALRHGLFDDTFWHLASGRWMLDHHAVLTHDVFSYTVAGRPWHTPEWGYDVVLAESVRAIGPVTFWLASAGLATLTVAAVAWRSRLVGAGWTWTGLLCIETGAAVTLLFDVRPQMVSYLFVAVLLLVLSAARRRRGWLWPVPLLFAAWANLHGSFLLGLGILALEVVVTLAPARLGRLSAGDRLARGPVVAVFGLSALATFANPFGPGVYSSALGVTFNSTVRQLISEWQSPNFHDPTVLAVLLVPVAVTVAYLVFSRGDLPALELALAASLLVSSLDAVRFVPYFAIAWCALAARCPPVRQEGVRPTVLVWPVVGVLGVSFLHGPWYGAGQISESVPVRAVAYLEHHPGRILSTYLWNDYLDWRGRRVFVDGRTELYTGNGVLQRYLTLDHLTSEPDPTLRSYSVDYVLWPRGEALSTFLAHDPNWSTVWQSRTAVVFHRTSVTTSVKGP